MLNSPLWGLIKGLALNEKEVEERKSAATNHQHPDLFPPKKVLREFKDEIAAPLTAACELLLNKGLLCEDREMLML